MLLKAIPKEVLKKINIKDNVLIGQVEVCNDGQKLHLFHLCLQLWQMRCI